jgi:hypothetical protein
MSKKSYTHTPEIIKRGRPMLVGDPKPYVAFRCDTPNCGIETSAQPDTELVLVPRYWTVLSDGKHMCTQCTTKHKKGLL